MSVDDKSHLAEFARALHEAGWELIASGGTSKALSDAGLPVTTVESFTRSPEILGGRVKTLHPAIHGGILARDSEQDARDLERVHSAPIDMVVSNLYPFEATIAKPGVTEEEAIEKIDIGGVALTRAAAKNFIRVTIVCDPKDYDSVAGEVRATGNTSLATRRRLAQKAFAITSRYDSAIQTYLDGGSNAEDRGQAKGSPDATVIGLWSPVKLRYGENPHQSAELFTYRAGAGPLGGTVLQGKELSYNNLLDLDAAWRAVVAYSAPSIVIVKHLSPCGIASAEESATAFIAALGSDPVSAYGGVIAANRNVDGATVTAMGDLFVECMIAPGFSGDARALLAKRKNCRLLQMPDLQIEPEHDLRSITRGVLRQTVDRGDPESATWKIVSARQPTDEEMRALRFAWIACQHVKSNAIVFARGTATGGIGGGQPNRVDCVRIAAERAGEKSRGAVMASDAFFPFADSIEVAAQAGIAAVVHPGGSMRDAESIAAADKAGMALVVTGVRHFRH
jgi:phosphoribosylaminoimidazolecarboxamide formyltransferase/IMP cyclohydrolase